VTLVPSQSSQCGILGQGDTGSGFSSSTAVSAVCESIVTEHAEKEHLGHQYSTKLMDVSLAAGKRSIK
jgi:hypothetical protein